jgi:hypothetical protein
MRPAEDINKLINKMEDKTSAEMDKRVLNDVMSALDESNKNKAPIRKLIMKSPITKLAAAAVLLIVLYLLTSNSGKTAWAFEQSIEAIKNYKAVYMEGTMPDGSFECWVRSDDTGTQSKDFIVKTSNGISSWVKDGSTFIYVPQENTVYYENAVTSGFSKWLGPELLEMLAAMKSTKVIYGKDPDTGRDRVTVNKTCCRPEAVE